MGAAILGPHCPTLDVKMHDFRMAKDLGIVASMHQGGGAARTPEGWVRLEAEELLGPRINVVQGNNLIDDQCRCCCNIPTLPSA